jgi:hypothetical protein
MLLKVHGRKKQLEAQFQSCLSGAVTATGSGTVITEDIMEELIRPIFKAKDTASQRG